MEYKEKWVNNNGVKINYLDYGIENDKAVFVIIPGLHENADDYIEIMKSFSDRSFIAITLRGRNKSDTPETGYTLEDHISDITTVVNALNLSQIVIMGFSRGVSYAIGYALKNPEKIKGIIIGDYPAVHTALPEGWVEFMLSKESWRGKLIKERIAVHALEGIQKESKQVSFWDDLKTLNCPLLVIYGLKPGAIITSDDLEYYKGSHPHVNLVEFAESDHNIFEPNIKPFIESVKTFLSKL